MLTDGYWKPAEIRTGEQGHGPPVARVVHRALAGRDPPTASAAAAADLEDRRTDDVAVLVLKVRALGGRNRRLLGRHREDRAPALAASAAGPDPVATVPVPVPDRGWARAGGQVVPPGGGWLALQHRTNPRAWTVLLVLSGAAGRALTPVGTALHPSRVGEVDQTVGNVNVTMELARSSTNVTSGASASRSTSVGTRRVDPFAMGIACGRTGRHDGRAHPIRVRHDLDGDPPTAPSL